MSYLRLANLSPEQLQTYEVLTVLENQVAHAKLIEAEKRAFAENEKKQAENAKELAKHLEETRREREREEKRMREESNKNLQVELRERFFRANPMALESDYLRVKDTLKDSYFVERMKSEKSAEDFIRNSGNYSAM